MKHDTIVLIVLGHVLGVSGYTKDVSQVTGSQHVRSKFPTSMDKIYLLLVYRVVSSLEEMSEWGGRRAHL
jgi:hypothetical protein